MSDIEVGFEESDIACTVVLLKRAVEANVTPVPDAVLITSGSQEGWRRAAINHLQSARLHRKEPAALRTMKKYNDEQRWLEYNEELDWHARNGR